MRPAKSDAIIAGPAKADFPLDFLSLATVRRREELATHNGDINAADVSIRWDCLG